MATLNWRFHSTGYWEQEVVNLFKDFEILVDGKFSGEIPILKPLGGDWDFIGGYIKSIEGELEF